MSAPWNGLPDQPERSGWHWLKPHHDNYTVPFEWNPDEGCWEVDIDEDGSPAEMVNSGYQYICRCPDPSELAQMRKGERERAAKAAQSISCHYYALCDAAENDVDAVAFDERMVAANECAKAIRSLPDEEVVSNEIDASWCDNPTCPHCGKEEDDYCDIDHSDGAETEMTCGACGKDYEAMANVMIRWSSRKMNEDYP